MRLINKNDTKRNTEKLIPTALETNCYCPDQIFSAQKRTYCPVFQSLRPYYWLGKNHIAMTELTA